MPYKLLRPLPTSPGCWKTYPKFVYFQKMHGYCALSIYVKQNLSFFVQFFIEEHGWILIIGLNSQANFSSISIFKAVGCRKAVTRRHLFSALRKFVHDYNLSAKRNPLTWHRDKKKPLWKFFQSIRKFQYWQHLYLGCVNITWKFYR